MNIFANSVQVAASANGNTKAFHQLLSLCLHSRDELLWTEFVRRSQPVIAGVVIKTVRRWTRPTLALVDDLVQETYLKLFANNAAALRRFVCRHEHALYGFLKVIASNVVQDHFRCFCSQKRGSGREEESIEQADAKVVSGGLIGRRVSAIAGLQHGLDRRILLRDIDTYLKSRASEPTFVRDYTIFWLYYREGMTAKAIAGVPSIGLSVKGVESTLLRLTRLVRTRFDQRSGGLRAASSRLLAHQTQPEG